MAFLAAVLLGACDQTPDPREIEGAIGYLAQALEEDDAARLYRVLDERSRHALISIVADRRASAGVIRASYPEDERASALEALGDAADVATPEELFARRCARGAAEDQPEGAHPQHLIDERGSAAGEEEQRRDRQRGRVGPRHQRARSRSTCSRS